MHITSNPLLSIKTLKYKQRRSNPDISKITEIFNSHLQNEFSIYYLKSSLSNHTPSKNSIIKSRHQYNQAAKTPQLR
jgi:hypothetical protein